MLKFAVPAVAALALLAVAAQSRATDSDASTMSGDMGWHLSHEPGMAKLAYGMANSDQLALMMTCERGQARAAVYGDVKPVGARLLRASMTSSEIDPLDGDLGADALIATRSPVLQDLARHGTLAVEGEAGAFELNASADERRLIGEFIAYCGSDKA